MKGNLTINRLALGNLRRRRRQYSIMILGIALAMIFSSSIPLLLASASETEQSIRRAKYGGQNAIICSSELNDDFYREASSDGYIEKYALAHIVGYAYTDEDQKRLGSSVAWLDEGARELSNQIFLEGAYPENENELAGEKTALSKLGYKDAQPGDIITLTVDVQNGGSYLGAVRKEYLLTGILSDKKTNLDGADFTNYNTSIPALFLSEGTQTEPGGKEKLSAYVVLTKKVLANEEELYGYISGWRSTGYDEDSDLYIHHMDMSTAFSADVFFYGGESLVTVITVLVLACCVAIFTSFNSNLSERRRQIGMLRAVGATKRQIVKVYGREALMISLIAVLPSIALSYLLVRVLLLLTSNAAVMTKSVLLLPLIAVIDVAVVMLACYAALLSAARITPMQAIRNMENSRRVRIKKIMSRKRYDPPRLLASRAAVFYKGSSVTVTVILTLSIIVSVLGFSSLSYSKRNMYKFPFDYRLGFIGEYNLMFNRPEFDNFRMSESELYEIASSPFFEEVSGSKRVNAALVSEKLSDYRFLVSQVVSPETLYEGFGCDLESVKQSYGVSYYSAYDSIKKALETDSVITPISIHSFSPQMLERICGRLDGETLEKLNSGEGALLIAPEKVSMIYNDLGNGKAVYGTLNDSELSKRDAGSVIAEAERDMAPGEKLDLIISTLDYVWLGDDWGYSASEKEECELEICSVISLDNTAFRNYSLPDYSLLTTNEGMEKLCPGASYAGIYAYSAGHADDDLDAKITEFLQPYADKYSSYVNSNYAYNKELERQQRSRMLTVLAVVMIGFTVCAGIINNSLSVKIRVDKPVIGTLRAVGASLSELVRGYIYQMLSMFTTGMAVGFILSAVIMLIMKLSHEYRSSAGFPMLFSPWNALLMTAAMLLICAFNLRSKVRNELKHSIVENIREL